MVQEEGGGRRSWRHHRFAQERMSVERMYQALLQDNCHHRERPLTSRTCVVASRVSTKFWEHKVQVEEEVVGRLADQDLPRQQLQLEVRAVSRTR